MTLYYRITKLYSYKNDPYYYGTMFGTEPSNNSYGPIEGREFIGFYMEKPLGLDQDVPYICERFVEDGRPSSYEEGIVFNKPVIEF